MKTVRYWRGTRPPHPELEPTNPIAPLQGTIASWRRAIDDMFGDEVHFYLCDDLDELELAGRRPSTHLIQIVSGDGKLTTREHPSRQTADIDFDWFVKQLEGRGYTGEETTPPDGPDPLFGP